MHLNTNLKHLRNIHKLSYRQLSKYTNVPHTVLERIEKEKTKDPSISTVLKIANYFNVSIDDLVNKDLEKQHGHHVHVGKERQ